VEIGCSPRNVGWGCGRFAKGSLALIVDYSLNTSGYSNSTGSIIAVYFVFTITRFSLKSAKSFS